jgi:hypothetical protein
MVLIIHGEDNLTSRNFYLSCKDKNSLFFDAENINIVELSQAINGSGLFLSSGKIFIDNLFTRKGLKSQKEIIEILIKSSDLSVFLYADKEVSIKEFSQIRELEQKNFKINVNIWNFLDNIEPNNKNNIFEFHKVLKGSEPEIIFAMLVRQFRLLLSISSKSENNISEVKRLAPWQKSKLLRHASLYSEIKLIQILKKLYKMDKALKTGKSHLSLTQNIDFLLLEI